MRSRATLFATFVTAAALAPGLFAAQAPTRLGVYAYSRDSAAGFQDALLDLFRRELGKHVESFAQLAYGHDDADVSVQLLGPGDLSVEIGEIDEPVRYHFRGDEDATKFWAVVHVGAYSKEFAVLGSGGRDMSRLAKNIGNWIQANSKAIRERPRPGGDAHGGASPSPQGHVRGGAADFPREDNSLCSGSLLARARLGGWYVSCILRSTEIPRWRGGRAVPSP